MSKKFKNQGEVLIYVALCISRFLMKFTPWTILEENYIAFCFQPKKYTNLKGSSKRGLGDNGRPV
jgi:hypothetical protein